MALWLKAPIPFISRIDFVASSYLPHTRKSRVVTMRVSSMPQRQTQQQLEKLSSSFTSFPITLPQQHTQQLQIVQRSLTPFSIMVIGCTGEMGKEIIEAATSAGVEVVPVSFSSSEEKSGQIVQVGSHSIHLHGPSEREKILEPLLVEYPDMIVVDFTMPAAVNENADLYCKVGVPFVMGTTGGDRERLYKSVEESEVYAVISPQMGKPVVEFLAKIEAWAEQFPGSLSGYSLQVIESHQASKLDTSGTAKAAISYFQKLGVHLDQIEKIRDPEQQLQMGVPEEYLSCHAFHTYRLTSPDGIPFKEFHHNVCGRSIYAEGVVDAARFLIEKVRSKTDKRLYTMTDVLHEGYMR